MKLILAGLLSVSLGGAAGAATYASDNFTNATTDGDTVANAEAAGVGSYRRVFTNASAFSVGTVSGFGSGNVLTLTDGSSTHVRALNSSTGYSLGSLGVGSVVSMSFDMRLTGTLTASRFFSFGILNDVSATQSSIAYALVGADGGEFRRRDTSWNMSTSTGNGGGRAGNVFTGGGLAVDTNYTMQLTITKTSAGMYTLRYIQNGVEISAQQSSLTSTVISREITGVGFRWSDPAGVETHIDNVLVTVDAVPEASSAAMVMAAGVTALLRRRRR